METTRDTFVSKSQLGIPPPLMKYVPRSSSSDWAQCGNEVSTESGCRMLLNAESKAKVNLKI